MEPENRDLGLLLVEQFREQINNLSAAVQLLTPVVQEKAGPQYDLYLAILQQSIYRMLRMLGNLEYLELPEDTSPPPATTLDLAGLCRQLVQQVAELSELAGVTFSYEGETESLLTCGESALLRRMLLGLIANAIHAAGKGGQAGLRLAVRHGNASLTVWDNGPGLQLYSEDDSLLPRSDGLGLGLRVARRIAARHGGSIVFEQRENRGSRAIVTLPIRQAEGTPLLRTPAMGYDARGGFSDLLVELANVLPFEAFLPKHLE